MRRYVPEDAAALATVMWRSVRVGALADYSGAQTEAWLPVPRSAEEMHRWASDGRTVFVTTTEADGVVGYLDLEADGHIDHLYRVPERTPHRRPSPASPSSSTSRRSPGCSG